MGFPTMDLKKKEIGSSIAIAIKVVKPGNAPTNIPRNNPPDMYSMVSRRSANPIPCKNDSNMSRLSEKRLI